MQGKPQPEPTKPNLTEDPDVSFSLPEEGNWDDRTLDLLLERAKLFEAEAIKDASTLLTKVAAGFAGLFALCGAVATARDTLWWRPLTDNPGAFTLGYFELIVGLATAACFLMAYRRIPLDISPDIEDVAQWNEQVRKPLTHAKADLLISIQRDVIANERSVKRRSDWIGRGFLLLATLLVIISIHTCWSGTLKSETEKQEAMRKEKGRIEMGSNQQQSAPQQAAPSKPQETYTPKPLKPTTIQRGGASGIVHKDGNKK